ncbi:hypothetical protein MMPV_009319 [Pyropia vietnamensis]
MVPLADLPRPPVACVVCLTAPPALTLRPCGHTPLCAACALGLPPPPRCPLCRSPVTAAASAVDGAPVDLAAAIAARAAVDVATWRAVLQVALVGGPGVGKGGVLRALCQTFPFVYAANASVRGRRVRFYVVPLGDATTAAARRAIVGHLASPPPHVIILVASLSSPASLQNIANWDMYIRHHPTWSPPPSAPPMSTSAGALVPEALDARRGSPAGSVLRSSSGRLPPGRPAPSVPVSLTLPTTWANTPRRQLIITTNPNESGMPFAGSIDVREDVPTAFPAGGVGGSPIIVKAEGRSGGVGYGIRRLGLAVVAAGAAAGWGGSQPLVAGAGLRNAISAWWLRRTVGRVPPPAEAVVPSLEPRATRRPLVGSAPERRTAAATVPGARRPDNYGPPGDELAWA